MAEQCCNWEHVRACGKVPFNFDREPICACGCSAYDERCGGDEWWLPETLDHRVAYARARIVDKWRPLLTLGLTGLLVTAEEHDELMALAAYDLEHNPPATTYDLVALGTIGDFWSTPLVIASPEEVRLQRAELAT